MFIMLLDVMCAIMYTYIYIYITYIILDRRKRDPVPC